MGNGSLDPQEEGMELRPLELGCKEESGLSVSAAWEEEPVSAAVGSWSSKGVIHSLL